VTTKMLTPNFSVDEFSCKHCGVCRAEMSFVRLVQKLRDEISRPLEINSGFRCAAHPVERSKPPGTFSAHTYGIAADISCPSLSLKALFNAILQHPELKGLGVNPWQNYIHIDARSKPARWAYSRMGATVPWSGKWDDLGEATGFIFKVE